MKEPKMVQTPEEKLQSIAKLRNLNEGNFVELGQLLSEVKRSKMFKYRGYPTFKQFVEDECHIGSGMAAKVVGVYEMFVIDQDVPEKDVIDMGLDKLNMIRPMCKGASYQEIQDWLHKAAEMTTTELREEIREKREADRETGKTMREILIDQYLERMVSHFNCGRKELNFNLALYFQDMDLDEVATRIKKKRAEFERIQEA